MNNYIITIAINSWKLQLEGHVNPLILPVQVGRVNTRRKSGIPRSTGTSREASPSRYGAARGVRVAHGRPGARPLLTEQILRQSQEAESALADALVSLYDSSCLPSLASSLASLLAFNIQHLLVTSLEDCMNTSFTMLLCYKLRNSHRCRNHK